jgi:hypothetical protein
VFGELGVVMRDAASALATGDIRPAETASHAAARAEESIGELKRAILVGSDTARWAPLRRPARGELARYARTVEHAELAARSARTLARNVVIYVRSGRPAQAELATAIGELSSAALELPSQFGEPWRGGDVLRTAMQAAGMATSAAARHPDLALNEIAGQVRSIAIDILKASEAGETDRGPLVEAPTEELLAAVPLPYAAGS